MDLADRDRARVDEELERLRDEPFLGAFAVPLPKLVDGGEDAARAFDRMGELLGASDEPATLHFRVREGEGESSFVVHTGAEGSKVTSEVVGRPDVEVIVSAETWNEIAAGAISPLEAFGRGLMRVRGDVNVAWKVARKLGDKAAGSSRR